MKKSSINFFLAVICLLCLTPVGSAQTQSELDASLETLRIRLSQSLEVASQNQLQIISLKPSTMENIVEVEISTGEILYSDISGQFLFAGDMFQTSPTGLVNLSAQARQVKTKEKIDSIPIDEMIVFSPRTTKATISVFTDVDCTYCRALHRDMDDLLKLGIEVRYLAYPRGGEMAGSYSKMVSVWCSKDRKKSLTQAKNDQNLPKFDCENPILKHYELGNQIGISGTPAIILPDGQVVPGYMDSERLAELLAISN